MMAESAGVDTGAGAAGTMTAGAFPLPARGADVNKSLAMAKTMVRMAVLKQSSEVRPFVVDVEAVNAATVFPVASTTCPSTPILAPGLSLLNGFIQKDVMVTCKVYGESGCTIGPSSRGKRSRAA
jgi:hypothetical protein